MINYELNSNIYLEKIDEEYMILNLNSDHYQSLNETGSIILDCILNKESFQEIVDKLYSKYEVEKDSLNSYVEHFIKDLIENQILICIE